ncbi:DNA-binding transcriptional activator of the SARP family [Geodermatophilus aquaeductus]|uniref:DNA-binding transcriptional activator of the SARP family n=1 Tax=Geodermatophilus aquaeductus TaxID=1564161 RepID=A0A521FDT1_9ACTN|nr:BTAD domain-containing putative transcriptional regulator [Geodermatophilus aquaeductus]SMO94335.1 DNA-binding transcriptional activator of the SARP family [Geodermatophilus aquaeductus]
MSVTFGVLGPVTAEDGAGRALPLGGPRHRELLARLLVARGRVVPLPVLVDDLWDVPADGAVAAVRTFVAALRRALEPDRPPRTAARLLVTEGSGYALRPGPDDVDAWRAERVLAGPADLVTLEEVLAAWRGPALADVGDRPWAAPDRARWAELHDTAVERAAAALLDLGRPDDAVPRLDAHVTGHPWREEGWRLLALALYRSGRAPDALAVLRRARGRLAGELGLDPGERLVALEAQVLRRDPALDRRPPQGAEAVWARAAGSWERTVGARARLESSVTLLGALAVSGAAGLTAAREQRLATVAAAEELGDPLLTARVVGSFDVPSVWTRSDDPEGSAALVAAAERALDRLPADAAVPLRARLLTTVAVESRGLPGPRGPAAARAAEELARGSGDPALLASALGAVYLHTCDRAGLAARRDAVGAELVALAGRAGLDTHLVLGHLVRLQARTALGDLAGAAEHADVLDALAVRAERPLATVFTTAWRALHRVLAGAPGAEDVLTAALRPFGDAGMPGVAEGLLPLALTCLRVGRGEPAGPVGDPGPYTPWVRPHRLLAQDRAGEAAAALRDLPDPPPGLLLEALWVLAGRAAVAVGDRGLARRAADALRPAAGEIAGAGSGLLTAGPVDATLALLA